MTYEGQHYRVVDAWCEPKPDPMIPILIGAGKTKMLRLTAQYADLWNSGSCDIATCRQRLEILRQHCDDLGRDLSTLRLTWFGSLVIAETQAEAQQAATDIIGSFGFIGTPEHIAAQMGAFVDAGIDYFMVKITGLPDPDIITLVTGELIPRVQALSS